ncbi:MAG TPA: HTTM domain-containing protein [Polyangiaceae bacterium]
MARSENPLEAEYWTGGVDPRPLALFRIGVGLSLLHDLVNLAGDVRPFLTDEGMLPHGVARTGTTWSLFDLVSTPAGASVVLAFGAAALVAFTIGWHTRLATLAAWVFVSSVEHRNHFMADGGDAITKAMLFWALFADLGAAYGVDARRRATRVVEVPAFGARLLQLQVALLYSGAARVKMRFGWLKDNAVYYAMQIHGFTRPPGALLGRFPALCRVGTLATLAMEAVFPFTVFSPWAIRACRIATVALGLAIQLLILVTMRVGVFTEVMLSCVALFLLPEWIDAVEAKVRARGWLAEDARPASVVSHPRWAKAVYAAMGVQFVLALWGDAFSRWVPLPAPLAAEVQLLDVQASYNMFSTAVDDSRWRGDGVLEDGTPVEVVSVAAPEAASDAPGWVFSRWSKIVLNEHQRGFPFGPLGAYFCRTFDERRPGSPLRSFTLVDDVTPAHAPGVTPTVRPAVLWKETCPR